MSTPGPDAAGGDAGISRGESAPDRASETTRRTAVGDGVRTVGAVALVGAYVFAISGVWPPFVAVESGSMEPNLQVNDLVFVVEEDRFPGAGSVAGTGVVTTSAGTATGHTSFQRPGDVIVFAPDGNRDATPIIHRATLYVEDDENWYDRANPASLGDAESCAEVPGCPAPHAGFVTTGDATGEYDQVRDLPGCRGSCDPVKPAWVRGIADYRVPGLGWLRLQG